MTKPNTETKQEKRHITIRVGEEEVTQINRIAKQYGVTLSDAMRWAVRAGLIQLNKKDIPDALRTRR